MAYNPNQGGTYNLGASISSTQNTILLSSFLEPVSGTPLTMVYLNTAIAFGTIAPTTSSSELISFTGITQNSNGTATLTGVTRGLQKAYPYTSSATFQLPHPGQAIFILSDAPQVFNEYASLENNQVFAGTQEFQAQVTFDVPPIGVNPGGQPNASTTVSGIVQQATTAQVNSGTATGSTGAKLFFTPADFQASNIGLADVGNNTDVAVGTGNKFVTQTGLIHGTEKYATTTGSANAYVATLSPVPTSLTAGMALSLIANFSNTGAATLAVNGLGSTPAITKNGTSALVANDIINGEAFTVIWDGTRWQLQNPSANLTFLGIFNSGTTSKNAADASTTQNIAHSLGVIPKWIEIDFYLYAGGSGSISPVLFAKSYYNGTTQSSTSFYSIAGTGVEATVDTTFTLNGAASAQTTVGTITFDATNIKIAWVKTGTPTGLYTGIWKAFA